MTKTHELRVGNHVQVWELNHAGGRLLEERPMNEFQFKPDKDIDGAGACNNGDRADRAEKLCRQAVLTNPHSSDPTESYFVSDMLSDCFHLCDKMGWDVELVIANAKSNWRSER